MTFSEFFEAYYVPHHPDLAERSIKEYRLEVSLFDRWHGSAVTMDDLCDDTLAFYLRHRSQPPRSLATAKKSRLHLLAIWRFAVRKKRCPESPLDVPTIRVPHQPPDAWTPKSVGLILDACAFAPALSGWGPAEWKALVLTSYDTALRIGCLMQTPASAVDFERGTLRTDGRHHKSRRGQVHTLHPDTLAAIKATMAGRPSKRAMLFGYPYKRASLLKRYAAILIAAGLPSGCRDKFHKLRRTSYTQVAITLGVPAATAHAGHSTDLSKHYLDQTQLQHQAAAHLIARPVITVTAH